jgi:hypothetical protein
MNLIFLPNDHSVIHVAEPLPDTPGPAPLASVHAACCAAAAIFHTYQAEGYPLPLDGYQFGGFLLAFPFADRPALGYHKPARLTSDQVRVKKMKDQGLTARQIAAKMRRQRRWVHYRLAELKHMNLRRSRDSGINDA